MPGETQNGGVQGGMQCAEFDALLGDALDHTLTGARREDFQAHALTCAVCGPLLQEVEAGRNWLKSLEEVPPPPTLVRRILEATSGTQPSWWERFTTAVIAPLTSAARQPRFVMSFGMAFFSLSISLSLAGVKLSDLRNVDLRPSAIKRQYYETSGRVVKYYENIRVVYEIESRMQQLKQAAPPPEPAPEEEKDKNRHNNTSEEPDQKQERNYSQDETQPVLASAPLYPPVVKVTTYRRFV